MEQEYIGRNYDGSYRIKGQPASYYLLPKGISLLKRSKDDSKDDLDPKGLNLLYYNRSASEGFVNHCMDVFRLYLKFDELYGTSLEFFTRSEIAQEQRFPRPLPDADLVLQHKQAEDSEYMLELIGQDLPWFTVRRHIKRYLRHFGDGDWDETQGDYPALLLVCENTLMERQIQRLAVRLLNQAEIEEELKVYTTTTKALLEQKSRKTAAWSDVLEPEDLLTL